MHYNINRNFFWNKSKDEEEARATIPTIKWIKYVDGNAMEVLALET